MKRDKFLKLLGIGTASATIAPFYYSPFRDKNKNVLDGDFHISIFEYGGKTSMALLVGDRILKFSIETTEDKYQDEKKLKKHLVTF